MGFKVRPFEKVFERPEGTAAVKVSGSIIDGVFVFSVHGSSWHLATDACGTDQHGAYAILKAGNIKLADGFIIRVQEDNDASDEEGHPASGCEISLLKPGDPQVYEGMIPEQGLTPDQCELLVPPEALIYVLFGPTGYVHGYGCTGLPNEESTSPEVKRYLI